MFIRIAEYGAEIDKEKKYVLLANRFPFFFVTHFVRVRSHIYHDSYAEIMNFSNYRNVFFCNEISIHKKEMLMDTYEEALEAVEKLKYLKKFTKHTWKDTEKRTKTVKWFWF